MARTREASPDGYGLDLDRGTAAGFGGKAAALMTPGDLAGRDATRAGYRDLDAAVDQMPGLTQLGKDRERAVPRDQTAAAGHPATIRQLPEPDSIRGTFSSRQRKTRAITKRTTQDDMPGTQYQALASFATDQAARDQLNNALSDAVGDAQQLIDTDRQQAQRLDRAIAGYERQNTRGHVIYTNLQMPAAVRGSSLVSLQQAFRPGSVVSFDRYTGGAHAAHEVEPGGGARNAPMLEIQTRRGIYLGRSDSANDSTHLLPRGLQLRVVSVHEAAYRRPDGSTGRRPVIQLQDADPGADS